VRAARLIWDKLTTTLEEWGFVINLYDVCVANKTINGKHCTVTWHVDDLKISHEDRQVVDGFIKQVDEEFGKESPLTESRGGIHDYLGTAPGVVRMDMSGYIQTILSEAPKDMDGTLTTPATAHLFKVNTDSPVYLDSIRAEVFHRITMQLMYLGLRERPDVLTTVSFLRTRVQQPDEDDYKKLARVIRYLRGTTDLDLRLSGDASKSLQKWADASNDFSSGFEGQPDANMSMGKGSVNIQSCKQKLMSRSSTDAELIGVYDVSAQSPVSG
jgi:hypothetical protein